MLSLHAEGTCINSDPIAVSVNPTMFQTGGSIIIEGNEIRESTNAKIKLYRSHRGTPGRDFVEEYNMVLENETITIDKPEWYLLDPGYYEIDLVVGDNDVIVGWRYFEKLLNLTTFNIAVNPTEVTPTATVSFNWAVPELEHMFAIVYSGDSFVLYQTVFRDEYRRKQCIA